MIPPNPPAPVDSPVTVVSPNPPTLLVPPAPSIVLASAPRASAFTPPTANLELSSISASALNNNPGISSVTVVSRISPGSSKSPSGVVVSTSPLKSWKIFTSNGVVGIDIIATVAPVAIKAAISASASASMALKSSCENVKETSHLFAGLHPVLSVVLRFNTSPTKSIVVSSVALYCLGYPFYSNCSRNARS